ncbi:MAG: tandem-95 repeat protein, partial [Bacteroidetes Order II. Incertae sedis bacterium]|nr:tandem-95 repeat protein [Bacteroidetes Order II. bacterium]
LSATDADGDALTYTATQPANGSVTVAGAVATYTPNANYNGADSFTFTANDGTVDSASATVSVTVTAVNDAPVAVAQSIAVAEDTPGAATLAGSDVDGDALTFSIASQPSNGTVSLVGTTATYTPGANYSGADSFTFVANDGTVDSDPATVTVTVSGVNDAPVATDLTGSGAEDTMISVVLIATDSEGDPVTYALVSDASNGSVVVTGAQAVYTPEANYNGTDSFTYSASDQNATSAPATVTLTVTSVNDAPSVENVSVSTTNDAAAAVQFLGSDVDGDALTFSIAAAPAFGTVTVSGSSASYQANAGFVGTDSFGYVANDGTDDSAMGVVSITVLPALTFSVQFINSGGSGIPSAVDVYYGGSLVATGLSARAGTVYLTLPAGGVTVAVAESPSVSAASAFASYTPGWSQGDQVVAVLSGVGGSPASTRLISFSGSSASSDPALIDARFVHASGASGVLDIGTISTTSDHLPLVGYASGVTFESVTSVQTLPSESAVFRVKNSGISGATLGEYQIDLSSDAGDSMTMILAGQSGGTGLDDLVLFGISADGTPRIPVTVTDIDYESEQPKEFVLDGNFPNPFNPSTNIQFDLPSQAEVKVDVLDLLGRNMISIPAQTFGAGPDQSISIDASSLPSGIYIYRVVAHTSAKTFVSTRTMTLIK